ncbi:hypothetical protein BV20DRAFT_970676 [Pilatotrama ljubarskyi]|nr:hypothetical protein BV20DRAFT_970676 [Pilatotrama ljubarskyi]
MRDLSETPSDATIPRFVSPPDASVLSTREVFLRQVEGASRAIRGCFEVIPRNNASRGVSDFCD